MPSDNNIRQIIRRSNIGIAVSFGVVMFTCQLRAQVMQTLDQLTAKADALYQGGNSDAAIAEYNRVLAFNLNAAQASIVLLRRGNCYYAKHDLDRAIADFDQSIRLNPRNSAAYDNRALALEARGDWDDARKDYNESLRLNPRNASAYLNRAGLFYEEGDFDLALRDYAKALTLNPRLPEAHAGRSLVYVWRKQPRKALTEANAAIAIAPYEVPGYGSRAEAYSQMGRYADAETDLMRVLKTKNYDSKTGLYSLAWLRATCPDARFRNGAEALEAAQKRCDPLNFYSYACLDLLGVVHAELGNFDRATSYEIQALEKAPPHHPIVADMKKRLELFKKHKPYRDEPLR
jgi:tetratricopeptide (TPR) repeat protein